MVEAKSVYENLKQHEKSVEEVHRALLKLFENKENIKSIISFLNSQNQVNHDTKRNTQ
jgi:SOS response regulatory protein OraA/RecX